MEKISKLQSRRMRMWRVMIISILSTLGTNAQLLTTTEKIPLGEFKHTQIIRRHAEWRPNEFSKDAGRSVVVTISINFR